MQIVRNARRHADHDRARLTGQVVSAGRPGAERPLNATEAPSELLDDLSRSDRLDASPFALSEGDIASSQHSQRSEMSQD